MKIKNYTKRNRILVFGVFLISVLIALAFLSRGAQDTQTIKTQVKLTNHELFLQLQQSNENDLAQYVDKAIEIEGKIKGITYRKGKYSIILDGDGQERQIICEMQNNQDSEVIKLKVGETILVKGILKGFLMDAILLNCILSK